MDEVIWVRPVLVVLGGGRCVWDDYSKVLERGSCHDVMCVNDIGMHFPAPLAHWYSNDAAMLSRWAAARRPSYLAPSMLHTNNGAGVSVPSGIRYWPEVVSGNSSISAVQVGSLLGYSSVIICGVPLDNSGWYFSPPWELSHYDNDYELDCWRRMGVAFSGRVTVVSGRLLEVLDGFDAD